MHTHVRMPLCEIQRADAHVCMDIDVIAKAGLFSTISHMLCHLFLSNRRAPLICVVSLLMHPGEVGQALRPLFVDSFNMCARPEHPLHMGRYMSNH